MNLRDLMQRWAEAGDETIGYDFVYDRGLIQVLMARVAPPDLTDQWSVTHGRKSFGGTPGDPAFDAHVLTAALEAIHARGWDCRLTSGTPRAGEWHAIVWIDAGTAAHRRSFDAHGASPAEALLAAYLKAIAKEAA